MRSRLAIGVLMLGAAAALPSARGDLIVQQGILSGTGSGTQDFAVSQFDSMGGTRQLNFVQIDLLTSVAGGYEADGSGVPVHIFARLAADYFLVSQPLGQTEALIDTVVPNTSPVAASVFNTDTDQTILSQPSDLLPWIGTGQLTLTADIEFEVFEDPPDVIFFGAGGTPRYTITYDYTLIPEPISAVLLAGGVVAALSRRRRRC